MPKKTGGYRRNAWKEKLILAVIKTIDLHHRYPQQKKGQWALEGIDLKVGEGEMHGLLGPDGAGKTTLLRILATVKKPYQGEAFVQGFSTSKQAAKICRIIGYMPQNFSLYPDLSVVENLNFFADTQGMEKRNKIERIDRMIDFARLGDFRDRRAGNLSGGMKKKLALGCALIHEPKILLLDEPSTGVDPVSRRELWLILSQVVAGGVTVFVSTPYMDEAERCHRVSILYQGAILTEGIPADLTSNLPYEIVEVRGKPRKITRQIVKALPSVLAWRPIGDRFRLAVRKPEETIQQLTTLLNEADVEIKLLTQSRRTMEDVFIHLVDAERLKQ